MNAFSDIFAAWETLLLWLVGFSLVFPLLSLWMPCNAGQPLWRKGSFTDILYFFLMPVATRFVRILFMGASVFLLFREQSPESIDAYIAHGYGPLSHAPVWLQAAAIFLAEDVLLYWLHRGFHSRKFWRWHAIHHSAEHVDWLTTYRFHPVNTWLSFTLVDALMLFAGFSPRAVFLMAGFNMIYSAMVHANLNWTFGPLRHIFASPVFHRWHHTAQEEGMDKNFAPTFPLLDIAFGTFYMPEGRRPEHYGVRGSVIPHTFLGQMVWPFRQKR